MSRPGGLRITATTLWVVFAIVLILPMVRVLWTAVYVDGQFSFAGVMEALATPGLVGVLLDTVRVVIPAAVLAVVIAAAFAWLNERSDARMGWVSRILPLVPLLLPPVALSIGWVFVAQDRAGFLNVMLRWVMDLVGIEHDSKGPIDIGSWAGLVWVYSLYLVPFAYLVIFAAMRNLDSRLEEASAVSGAGPWRTYWRVALPSVLPSIWSAFLMATITGLSLFSVPVVIGTPAGIEVLSVRIVRMVRSTYPPQTVQAVVLSLFLALIIGLIWYFQRRSERNQRHATIGGKAGVTTVVRLGILKWPLRLMMLGYLLAASVLPLIALVFVSLQRFWVPIPAWESLGLHNFQALFGQAGMALSSLRTSVTLGTVGATVATLIAAVLMVYTHMVRRRAETRFIDGVTKMPGVLSHIVVGVAFLVTYAGSPFNLHGTVFLLLLAYVVIYMPQATITAGSAAAQVGRDLVESSLAAGASQARTLRLVNLPLMAPGLVAGWATLFVLMAGDLTASALLAGPTNPVVGFVLLDIYSSGTYPQLAALATTIAVISMVVVSIVLALSRRLGVAASGQRGLKAAE